MKATSNPTELQKYTKRFINKNFLIKVYGRNEEGKKINQLYGVSGAINLIGVDFLEKFVDRAIKSGKDNITCKLRRGLQISLYSH